MTTPSDGADATAHPQQHSPPPSPLLHGHMHVVEWNGSKSRAEHEVPQIPLWQSPGWVHGAPQSVRLTMGGRGGKPGGLGG